MAVTYEKTFEIEIINELSASVYNRVLNYVLNHELNKNDSQLLEVNLLNQLKLAKRVNLFDYSSKALSITSFTFPPFFAVSIFIIWCKSARTRTVLSPIISFFALIGVSFRFAFCAPKFPTTTHFFLFLLTLILSSTITNHK